MEILDIWSFILILLCAFVIGWAAEAAQTFMSQALALSLLAWLQTLPEFAVEASIAWHQQRDLMVANLTGSLRLLVGLGWPMIFFVHFFFQGMRRQVFIREIVLGDEHFVSVFALFVSILYFTFILFKGGLTCIDSIFLVLIYVAYLVWITRFPAEEVEDPNELPWVAQKVVAMERPQKILTVTILFVAGGAGLYFSVHPFIETLQKWSLALGISTFVFVQWVAPFLSEFPEKVSAFNWARQSNKAPMAVMNMVSSNINQWTMLAAMIPLVFNLSLGAFEPVPFTGMHRTEMALTIAQSALGGLLLLDLRFSIWDATAIFILWLVQFINSSLREEILVVYLVWGGFEVVRMMFRFLIKQEVPRSFSAFMKWRQRK